MSASRVQVGTSIKWLQAEFKLKSLLIYREPRSFHDERDRDFIEYQANYDLCKVTTTCFDCDPEQGPEATILLHDYSALAHNHCKAPKEMVKPFRIPKGSLAVNCMFRNAEPGGIKSGSGKAFMLGYMDSLLAPSSHTVVQREKGKRLIHFYVVDKDE